ncbi:MAG: oxygen-independent coproporphyrinogen-3 oxidase, partial [Bacteroidia bacterium]
HFALPQDELVKARHTGNLQRNFQGYSVLRNCDLVGLGASAIGKVGYSYSQNYTNIRQWQASVESGELPIWRGISLQRDDLIRRKIIESIMCHGTVNRDEIENRFNIDYLEYFAGEMKSLQSLANDGLIKISENGFSVTEMGLVLLRAIAMVFDRFLVNGHRSNSFSKVI